MKNASKHAATLKSLLKRLSRDHKAQEHPKLDPLRALVLGVLREGCDDQSADEVMARFDEEFVDINELRVATELELEDLMGLKYPEAPERSVRLRDLLMELFDAEGRLTVDRIAALNKKEQRQVIRGVPLMTPFIEGHMCLLGFGQNAMPLDEPTLDWLIEQEVLEPETMLDDAQKFLEGQLKAEELLAFYTGCRAELFGSGAGGIKGKKGSAKKTAKKSA